MLSEYARGIKEIPKPPYILVENQREAYDLISQANRIKVHTDVDMDGFMSGYIMIKWLSSIGKKPLEIIINRGKNHGALGINSERVGNIDLLIILDSSTNELEQILKDTNVNVLIIDHHNIEPSAKIRAQYGDKVGLVVNNMTINEPKMSAGLLVYEFIRAKSLYDETLIENLMLYQCACISLITDSIIMDNPRNLYYAYKTFRTDENEKTLESMISEVTRYESTMSKSLLIYSIAPVFNKAIRAYRGPEALLMMLKSPENIKQLDCYADIQKGFIELALKSNIDISKPYILMNLSQLNIPETYCGVIASKLVNEYDKSSVCYIEQKDGTIKGSFRGLIDGYCYYDLLKEYNGVSVAGHQKAMGISGNLSDIEQGLCEVISNEPKQIDRIAISLGSAQGGYLHANNAEEWRQLKRNGALVELARANGVVSVAEQEYILVPIYDVKCLEEHEKYSKWTGWDMEFICMEPIGSSPYVKIYAEDNGREIKFYGRK